MLLTPSIMKDGPPLMLFSRSQVQFTSLASTGEPSENTAFGSRWKVNSVWSAFASQVVASRGCKRPVVRGEADQRLVDVVEIDLAGVAPGARRVERVDVEVAGDHQRLLLRQGAGRCPCADPGERGRRRPAIGGPAESRYVPLSFSLLFLRSHAASSSRTTAAMPGASSR